MKQKIFAKIEQVELFVINQPFMFQQIVNSIDDLLWIIYPVLDSFFSVVKSIVTILTKN